MLWTILWKNALIVDFLMLNQILNALYSNSFASVRSRIRFMNFVLKSSFNVKIHVTYLAHMFLLTLLFLARVLKRNH
jgi:hypothetical protein